MREVIATGKTVDEAIENGCRELGLSIEEVSYEIIEMPIKKLFKTIPAKVKVTPDEDDFAFTIDEIESKPAENKNTAKNAGKEELIQQETAKEISKQRDIQSRDNKVLENEPEIEINLADNKSANSAVVYLMDIFKAMGSETVEVKAYQQGDATLLRVEGEDIAKIIETRGETIQALSYLTDRAVNKGVDKRDNRYIRIRLDVAGYRSRRESELISLANRIGKDVAKTKKSKTLAPMNPYERLIIHTTISQLDGVISESTGSDAERRVVIKSTASDAVDGDDWKPANRKPPVKNNRNNRRGPKSERKATDNFKKSNTPDREYADKERDKNANPVVPDRRDAIRDGEDMPLYGKIEL